MLNWESEPTRNIHRCGGTCAKPVDTSLGTRNSWSTMARYRKGLPISSGIAESAVNQVVSLRMAKKRQMRWSDEGGARMLWPKSEWRTVTANCHRGHLATRPRRVNQPCCGYGMAKSRCRHSTRFCALSSTAPQTPKTASSLPRLTARDLYLLA